MYIHTYIYICIYIYIYWSYPRENASCPTYECNTSCIRMCRVTRVNVSCHARECAMSRM